MPPPNISTTLALNDDAPALAAILTAGFSASDAAYPLIWGSAPEGTHDAVSIKGLFTPVQKEGRVTYKAVDSVSGRIVGFATWNLPQPSLEGEAGAKKGGGGLPHFPGVNMELLNEKLEGTGKFSARDKRPDKDMHLVLCFVHPDFYRQGIASLLLQWGTRKADELHTNCWVAATPQAVTAYEKSGFKVIDRHDVDLGKYGGQGIYSRAWMLRLPMEEDK